ncbi:MAG: hypothetical protein JSS50_02835 [Proteobacteria bacterium]|nr:hypothetical protein [Pseudomonadota bacterium]
MLNDTSSLGMLPNLFSGIASTVSSGVSLLRAKNTTAEEQAIKAELQKQFKRQEELLQHAFNSILLAKAHKPEGADYERPENPVARNALRLGWYLDGLASFLIPSMLLSTALPASVAQLPFVTAVGLHFLLSGGTKILSLSGITAANGTNNPHGQYMSRDVARLLQTITAQSVLIASLAVFSTSQWEVMVRRLFHITTFKGGVIASYRTLLPDGSIEVRGVLYTPARLISRTIGMAIVGPMMVVLSDRMSSFMVNRFFAGDRKHGKEFSKKREDYLRQVSVLQVASQTSVMMVQLWLPYVITSHYLNFALGGLGYGLKYFVEDVAKGQDRYDAKAKDAAEEWGNRAFRVAIAASLGMVLYPMLPIHIIGEANVWNAMLLGTAISAVDAITKQFVLPALSDAKESDGSNMNWKKKLDLSISVMALAACVGFTMSASLYTASPVGGYMSMPIGFAPHLPGLWGFLIYLVAMPILYNMKEKKRFVTYYGTVGDEDNDDERNYIGTLYNLFPRLDKKNRIRYEWNSFVFDIFSNLFGSLMIANAFNLVLASETYKLVSDWLDSQDVLKAFLSWYEETTGAHFAYTLSFAFCMSFVFVGMDHIYKRLYQASSQKDALSDKNFTTIEILWRFLVEMSKYTMRFALTQTLYQKLIVEAGAVLINPAIDQVLCYMAVHILTGLTIGFLRAVGYDLIVSTSRSDNWKTLIHKPHYKLTEWGIGSLVFAFDQLFYYVNGAAIDKVVADYSHHIKDGHTTALSIWGCIGATGIEVAENIIFALSEAYAKLLGMMKQSGHREPDMAM